MQRDEPTPLELGEQLGEVLVAINFRHGHGEVFHMISPYHLQRSELRTRRHAATAMAYAAGKGVALAPEEAALAENLRVTDVEWAATSARVITNVVTAHKKLVVEREKKASGIGGSVTAHRHGGGRWADWTRNRRPKLRARVGFGGGCDGGRPRSFLQLV